MPGPEVLIFFGLFAMIAFVVWVSVSSRHRRQSAHALVSFQERLLDRLGSGPDLVAFAQTEAGEKLLTGTLGNQPPMVGAAARLLGAVHSGIVLVSLGAGLVTVGQLFDFEAADTLTALGVVAGFVGVGFLVSAVSCHRLLKALDVPEWTSPSAPQRPPDRINEGA